MGNLRRILVFFAIFIIGHCLFGRPASSVSLCGEWKLHYGFCGRNAPATPDELKTSNWPAIPAGVPGNVELDLLAAGMIADPEFGDNVYALRRYEAYRWWYSRSFETPSRAAGERIEIVFEGLDCFGTIWLNNRFVGKTDNMLVGHRFDITDFLARSGENTIHVRIDPAVLEARKYVNGSIGSRKFFRVEQEHVRKAPHMYGWDIMPRLLSAGLWREVRLEIVKPTRLEQAYWMTDDVDVTRKTAKILLDWQMATDRLPIDGLTMEVSLERNSKKACDAAFKLINHCGRHRLSLENVDFWWPRGYGEPALYDATVRILDEKKNVLDEKKQKIGVRTADLIRTDTTTGENPGEFVFEINKEKIFARGTNWVPLDAFHSRDKSRLNDAFRMIVDLNCNMIRCWGGNVYEDHDFFDLCDANGIMVWQDFSLAGTAYPQDDEFAEKIRKEAVSVILKLRGHPSLVLWSGNNEVDMSLEWNFSKAVDPEIDRISREVLRRAVWEYDPLRDYLPSSPYCGEDYFRQGNNEGILPEVHLWGPRGYYKAPFYTEVNAHFVSEIGYHGCPNRGSLERMFDPDYVYPWTSDGRWNDQWMTKAVRCHPDFTGTQDRNDLMTNQVKALFGEIPRDLDEFIFASQVVQAEALKFFIEFWRMDKFRKTGILWWNLRDGWPILSDAVVDFYNSKKLAYDYIRRVQPDACVMIGDPRDGRHPVVAVNDTREEKTGTVEVKAADTGEMLFSASFGIPANGKTTVGHIPTRDEQSMWLIDYAIGRDKSANHYLAGRAPFKLADYERWFKRLNIN